MQCSLAEFSPDTTQAAAVIEGLGLLPNGVPASATIFLPSDTAITNLIRLPINASSVAALSDTAKSALAAIALYHFHLGAVLASDELASAGSLAAALPGAVVTPALDQGWFSSALTLVDATGTAAVVTGDPVQACGSALYIIDTVLLPAGLLDPAFPAVSAEQAAAALSGEAAPGPAASPSPAFSPFLSPEQFPSPSPSPAPSLEGQLQSLLTPGVQPGDVAYDYLLLARQWGPSFCATTSCSKDAYNMFTIHGLWPNSADGSHPARCSTGQTFDPAELPAALRARMACQWPSYKGSDASFYRYQFDKHGVCSFPLFPNVTAYFAAAIGLNEVYSLEDALAAAGVDPLALAAQSVAPADLAQAVQAAWGATPQVTCSRGLVQEVRVCFSLDLQPIDCPGGTRCPSSPQAFADGGAVPSECAVLGGGMR